MNTPLPSLIEKIFFSPFLPDANKDRDLYFTIVLFTIGTLSMTVMVAIVFVAIGHQKWPTLLALLLAATLGMKTGRRLTVQGCAKLMHACVNPFYALGWWIETRNRIRTTQ